MAGVFDKFRGLAGLPAIEEDVRLFGRPHTLTGSGDTPGDVCDGDPAGWLAEQIGACEPDLLRSMVKTMAEALMSAKSDSVCGAEYGQRSGGRV